MEGTLTQRRRVNDEGLRVVKFCPQGRMASSDVLTVPEKEAPANYVPAAAVTRRGQALSGIIGRKGCVSGLSSQV